MAGEAGGQTALIFTPSSVATMKKGAAWRNRPEGDLIMSSTCEISPHEDFSSGRLTDCAAYGKPRSGLERSRVVFTKHGREDYPPVPTQAARRFKRASTEQDEHVVAPGFLSRVLALVRRQQVRA
jgi:hypothetical protein